MASSRVATRSASALLALGSVTLLGMFAAQQRGSGLPDSWCRWGAGVLDVAPLTTGRLFTTWQLDGVAVVSCALAALVYLVGIRQVRADAVSPRWPLARTALFLAGLGVVGLATCSAIGVYDMTQFWVHMVQHLLLIMVAPPLIAAGRPLGLWVAATRPRRRDRLQTLLRSRPVAALTAPPLALALYAGVIVGTHLGHSMGAIMQRPWLGQLEHLLYLITGWLFFVHLFGDEPLRWRLSMPARLALVVMSMAIDTFVGVILLQSTQAIDTAPHPGWGLNPLLDTQMGGGIMWSAGDGFMGVVAMILIVVWARSPEATSSGSWLQRARLSALEGHVGHPISTGDLDLDVDGDETALDAYNAWLARLNRR